MTEEDHMERVKETLCKNVWTEEIGFHLDGTVFTLRCNPLDQARAPVIRTVGPRMYF